MAAERLVALVDAGRVTFRPARWFSGQLWDNTAAWPSADPLVNSGAVVRFEVESIPRARHAQRSHQFRI